VSRRDRRKGPAAARIDADNGSLADDKVYSRPVPSQGSGDLDKGMRGLSLEEANTILPPPKSANAGR
jgi:hypothetical protein